MRSPVQTLEDASSNPLDGARRPAAWRGRRSFQVRIRRDGAAGEEYIAGMASRRTPRRKTRSKIMLWNLFSFALVLLAAVPARATWVLESGACRYVSGHACAIKPPARAP